MDGPANTLEDSAPPLPPVQHEQGPTSYQFEFGGSGGQYFRIWIVNLLLTLVTLGVYSAWAKVRKLKYLYGSTSLAGSAFGYHGPTLKILKGRVIATVLASIYFIATRTSPLATLAAVAVLGLVVPWLVVRSRMFAMRVTSWRGMRFGFTPDYAGAYRAMLGWMVLSVLTLGGLYPRAVRERFRFIVTRTYFGDSPAESNPKIWRYYKTALVSIGLFLFFLFVVVLTIAGVGKSFGFFGVPARGAVKPNLVIFQLLFVAGYLLVFVVVSAYVQSRNLNGVLDGMRLGPVTVRCRLGAMRLMGLYLTNLLGMLFTLGLFTPWAQVRLYRYRLQALEVQSAAPLDGFGATQDQLVTGPVAEEISELFDVDFGL